MLGLSLAVGVVQINVSLAMKGYLLVKRDKDVIGLFNEVISWFSILIGIILLALNMLLKLADGFKIAGIVFMVVGALLILVLGGRGKRASKDIRRVFATLRRRKLFQRYIVVQPFVRLGTFNGGHRNGRQRNLQSHHQYTDVQRHIRAWRYRSDPHFCGRARL